MVLTRVAVFGPGVIGLELGQALSRLGVEVKIFGVGGMLGGISDPVVLAEAKAVFSEELDLHLDAQTEVKLNADGKVEVQWTENGESGVYTADYLLAAVGRRPNVDRLDLENLTIQLDALACLLPIHSPCKPVFRIFLLRAMLPINCLCYTKPATKAKLQAKMQALIL